MAENTEMQKAVADLFNRDSILCVYGHEKDSGYTAYIKLSNGAVAEIQLNEAQ